MDDVRDVRPPAVPERVVTNRERLEEWMRQSDELLKGILPRDATIPLMEGR